MTAGSENIYPSGMGEGREKTGTQIIARAMLCITLLALLAAMNLYAYTGNAQAATGATDTTGTLSAKGTLASTPVAGPTGATIAVSGSGWQSVAAGTVVNFGYSATSSCTAATYTPAASEQAAIVSGGAFNGWFLWPAKTPVGLYTVCASLGSTLAVAGSYTVLSAAPAQLTISSSTFNVGQQAVVNGSNFLPPQTSITLVLQQLSGGTSIPMGTTTSDANGAFSQTYTIPANPTGPVELIASAGSGSPPTLSAAVTFIVYAAPPTPTPTTTPSPAPSPSPIPGQTATPTPVQAATPTTIPTQSTQATPTPGITATPIGLGTQPQTPTPTSSVQGIQQSSGQPPTPGRQSKNTVALVAGAAFMLLATALLVLLWWRKAKKRPTTLSSGIAARQQPQVAQAVHSTSSAQPATDWTAGPGWGDLPVEQVSPSLPVTQPNVSDNTIMAIRNSVPFEGRSETPTTHGTNGTAGSRAATAAPPILPTPAPAPPPASGDLLQDPLLAAIMQQARSGLFVLPGKQP